MIKVRALVEARGEINGIKFKVEEGSIILISKKKLKAFLLSGIFEPVN